jgi:Holliday junction DNA helicase RuvB
MSEKNNSLNIRPDRLEDYIGQKEIKNQLRVYIDSARIREERLDHILFSGGPGLGKTTLAQAVANEFDSKIYIANAAHMLKPKDIVSYLVSLEEGDFFFIDEIHRLKKELEEVLYTAMEDYRIDILVDRGSESVPISLDLPKFTLIGATTMKGKISTPLIERFGIDQVLREYDHSELQVIINRSSKIFKMNVSEEASLELAKRSRGTPRRANKILKRVVDFALVNSKNVIDLEFLLKILDNELMIDSFGLEEKDRNVLLSLYHDFDNCAVGIKNLATALGENIDTLEYNIEPYLISKNLIIRTPRGRKITKKGIKLIGED